MKKLISSVFFLVMAFSNVYADSVKVSSVVCVKSPGVTAWTYETSGNTVNGVRDTTVLLAVSLAEVTLADGTLVKNFLRIPVPSMHWRENFSRAVYESEGRSVECATLSGRKVKKNKACTFTANIRAASRSESNYECYGPMAPSQVFQPITFEGSLNIE